MYCRRNLPARLYLSFVPVLFLFLFSGPMTAAAQPYNRTPEAGLPYFIERFTPHTNPQNWSVVQDSSGVIYVANNDGILAYDGVRWRLIQPATEGLVRSLGLGPDGTVYVGMEGDIGRLVPDSSGTLAYESLTDELELDKREFDDVWTTTATSSSVYFQTSGELFRWDGSDMQTWRASDSLHTSFVVRDEFYVRIRNRGLFRMVDDSLKMIPDGDRFSDLSVFMMGPHRSGGILIGTLQEGLFLADETTIRPIDGDIADQFGQRGAYHGCKIRDGLYAVATLQGGIMIISDAGDVLDMLTADHELPGGVVNHVYPDQQGGLWAALHNQGIARVDIPTPLTAYGDQLGPDGIIYSMRRHEGTLYTATGRGLYYLDTEPVLEAGTRGQSKFRQVNGVPSTWSLLSYDNVLLASARDGIYAVAEPTGSARRLSERHAYSLRVDRADENRVLAGTRTGVISLEESEGRWTIRPLFPGVAEEIRSLVQTADDTLWLAGRYASSSGEGHVIRAVLSEPGASGAAIDRFGTDDGLPAGDVRIVGVDDQPVFTTAEGIFRFDDGTGRFVADDSFPIGNESASLRSFTQDDKGRLWVAYSDHVEVATPGNNGEYSIESPTALHLPLPPFTQLYIEPTGIAWISSDNELIRYDPGVRKDYDRPGRALIRQVETLQDGRTIFGGTYPGGQRASFAREIAYENNSLRFSVAAPFYNRPEATEFQFRLEGSGLGWSDWSPRATRTFADLGRGTYRLRVRARNIHGVVTRPVDFNFDILPPWYRTWWAYLGYAIVLGGAVVGTVRYRRLLREEEKARQQAKELAQERVINERLQDANRRLEEANEWKDTLVANISHELRTPLAGILGFTRVLKEEVTGHHHEFADLIEANGKRLRRTIDRLLDMSKLESGDMKLSVSDFDVNACVREVADSLRPLAKEKGLDLRVELPDTPTEAQLDREKVERIVYNLTGNAIKFTEEGHVCISAASDDTGIQIVVSDTGIGIAEEYHDHVFDAFTQESQGITRTHEGAGLGLFISRRLTALMNGTLDLESSKGKGAVFTVSLPHRITSQ